MVEQPAACAIKQQQGLLFIGDPHLSSRVIDWRKDDYGRVVLDKFSWCLDLAQHERLRPVILGDLLHYPRDNATWLVVELIDLLRGRGAVGIYGNHDIRESQLTENDTLSILVEAGSLRLLDAGCWQLDDCNGVQLLLGGTPYGQEIPSARPTHLPESDSTFWITHHDLIFGKPSPYQQQWSSLVDVPGVDLIVNGHLHRSYLEERHGSTTWINPGNISRTSRSSDNLVREPQVLAVRVDAKGAWQLERISVPHEAAEDIFHPKPEAQDGQYDSDFVVALEQLTRHQTEAAAGLDEFLQVNLQDEENPLVRQEILRLAELAKAE